MATVTPVITSISTDNKVQKVVWTLTQADSDGAPIKFNAYRDRCVQIAGVFDSGTVVLQGSNNGGTNWHTLNDPTGTDISATVASLFQVLESPESVRPVVTGEGVTAAIVITLILAKA